MSDLIKRSDLLELYEGCEGLKIPAEAVVQNIKDMPIAYDVDKVVKQLEELANEHPYKVIGEPQTYSEYSEGWEDCADRAVDIVERGGINEQTNNQK